MSLKPIFLTAGLAAAAHRSTRSWAISGRRVGSGTVWPRRPLFYVYWTVRNPKAPGGAEFVPELVHNRSGVGSHPIAIDLNKDGAIDIVTSVNRGTFIFRGKKAPGRSSWAARLCTFTRISAVWPCFFESFATKKLMAQNIYFAFRLHYTRRIQLYRSSMNIHIEGAK
jgi:hypothetical protein